MMKTIYYIALLLGCVLYLGCSKEKIIERPVPADGEIRLDGLAAGQSSIFKQYSAECGAEITYTGTELKLETILDEGQLYFQETLTEGNVVQDPVRYPVNVFDTYITIPDRQESRLFFFYGNDRISIAPEATVTLRQNECFLFDGLDRFIGNSIAEINEFDIGIAQEINQTVVSCVPNLDIDAYLVYDEYQLQASHTVSISEFGGQTDTWVHGWTLNDR